MELSVDFVVTFVLGLQLALFERPHCRVETKVGQSLLYLKLSLKPAVFLIGLRWSAVTLEEQVEKN